MSADNNFAPRKLRVFLCHSSDDKQAVRELYLRLRNDGMQPWLDEQDLIPGQDWQVEIPRAVRGSDVVLVCLSAQAVTKRGYIQKEITSALDVATEQPGDSIFLIPVRLEECPVPERLSRWQWVDLFEQQGYERLLRALETRRQDLWANSSAQISAPEPRDLASQPFLVEESSTHNSDAPPVSNKQQIPASRVSISWRDVKFATLAAVGCFVVVAAYFIWSILQPNLQPGDARVNPVDGLRYRWIPPGTFQMGCVPGDDHCADDEKRHPVTISRGFWLGESEVTQAAFQQLMYTNPSGFRGEDLPMDGVGSDIANHYCEGVGGRIPTEAEWEYAARGGKQNLIYPWGNHITHDNANFVGVEGKDKFDIEPAPVCSFSRNSYGLCDMAGNLSEWTMDYYDPSYGSGNPVIDPEGPSGGDFGVIRGGSFLSANRDLRTSSRHKVLNRYPSIDVGFRCALQGMPGYLNR